VNVEIVRELVDALNRADVEAMVERYYAPDAEFIPAMQAALEGTVYRGSEQIRAYYEEIYDVWDELRVELDEVCTRGDLVTATGRVRARGKASGVALDGPWAFEFRLAQDKVIWQRNSAVGGLGR
jgi:ketosteroid isomerase-like protein